MSNIAAAVLMVEPTTFGFDEETARSNVFQHRSRVSAAGARADATAEYHAVVQALRGFGVEVVSYRHDDHVPRPDAVFPNNWLTTWPDGRVFTYPMAAAARRRERTEGVIGALRSSHDVTNVIDLSAPESQGQFLEGTGAIVFDHINRVAYACESLRCDRELFERHVHDLGYEGVLFAAADAASVPIYHTNVMMGVQSDTAVVCGQAIGDARMRRHVVDMLEQTGHEVVETTYAQMEAYCGNVIELENSRGERCLLLSQSAFDALTPAQRRVLSRSRTLLPVAVPTIQEVGGGSVRCMVAEIFLVPVTAKQPA
jgi:hypothetical protein